MHCRICVRFLHLSVFTFSISLYPITRKIVNKYEMLKPPTRASSWWIFQVYLCLPMFLNHFATVSHTILAEMQIVPSGYMVNYCSVNIHQFYIYL